MDRHLIVLHDDFAVETDCACFAAFLRQVYGGRQATAQVRISVYRHADPPGDVAGGWPGDAERILVQRDPVLAEFERAGLRRSRPAGPGSGGTQTLIPASGTIVEHRGPQAPVMVWSPCTGHITDMISAYKRDDAFRTVRHVFYAHLLRAGYVWCHGAAVAGPRGALVIVGASRAGKTSTMTHLLRSGPFAFMTNGRSFIALSGTGHMEVYAFPEIVQLRQGFLNDNPDLAERLRVRPEARAGDAWQAPDSTKQPVFCTDFARALGVAERYRANVAALVIPVLDRGKLDVPPVVSADEVARIVAENLDVRQYLAEYSWYEDRAAAAPVIGERAVSAALRRLPRRTAYLDTDGRITLRALSGPVLVMRCVAGRNARRTRRPLTVPAPGGSALLPERRSSGYRAPWSRART